MELLKDAIAAFAFKNHTLEVLPTSVDVVVKQKIPTGLLKKFLKRDLISIWFNDKNRIDYGINYKILNSKLCFYGTVRSDFKNKTIAVQITNSRHKIIKEIWINGTSQEARREEGEIIRDEQVARGQGYEIY